MNLVYGSFCPLHEGKKFCPCRSLTTNASIWTAAELGDVERVRQLVLHKGRRADAIDAHGYTPLHFAAQNGRLGVVQFLLEAGARVDGVPSEAGGCGATPLHRAAFAGRIRCVRGLLSAGACTSAVDTSFLDRRTPLHKAASEGHLDVCIALLEAGADPNTHDASGSSVLDVVGSASPRQGAVARRKSGINGPDKTLGDSGPGAQNADATSCEVQKDWYGLAQAIQGHGGRRFRDEARAEEGSGNTRSVRDVSLESSGRGRVHQREESTTASRGAAATENGARPRFGERVGTVEHSFGGKDHADAAGPGAVDDTCDVSGSHLSARDRGSSEGGVGTGVQSVRARQANGRTFARERAAGDACSDDGFPCGECCLRKVVLARAKCCGALVCKACARDLSARRRDCSGCSHD